MINCLGKLVNKVRDEQSISNILKHMQNYNGADWKEYIIYNKYNSYATFPLYKNKMIEIKLIGLDSRYYYQTNNHSWIKVLENDIIINEQIQINNKVSRLYYKTITPSFPLCKLKPNNILIPKSDPTGSIHLIIL